MTDIEFTEPVLMKIKDCAERLGLSYYFISRVAKSGKVKTFKNGRVLLVSYPDLCRFLQNESNINE